ncbi:hypothetical protein [Actinomadura sp. 21ATH]|uniref:hypothetical protein n=1 Tax=Actinomadura sp. 21ATH TaxID=1735444 RepID=UPI0035C018A1
MPTIVGQQRPPRGDLTRAVTGAPLADPGRGRDEGHGNVAVEEGPGEGAGRDEIGSSPCAPEAGGQATPQVCATAASRCAAAPRIGLVQLLAGSAGFLWFVCPAVRPVERQVSRVQKVAW